MTVYNFSAGPSALPSVVRQQLREAILDARAGRPAVFELSHRGAAFAAVLERAAADLRQLLELGDEYHVLWMAGGATAQFSLLPMNLGVAGSYALTGHWAKKACEIAAFHGRPAIGCDGGPDYRRIPPPAEWHPAPDTGYRHITSNETIDGVQFHHPPPAAAGPLVVDASSDILSRPPVIGDFDLLYAGAQKNLGIAGVTLVLIHERLLDRCRRDLPPVFSYRAQAAANSLVNTPPVLAIVTAQLVLAWLSAQGGLAAVGENNRCKSEALYALIDADEFYQNRVAVADRSWMNVPFFIHDRRLEPVFLAAAEEAGLVGLAGHRATGGLRASLYNAVGGEALAALLELMAEFRRRYG